jgi:hypothetical protein
LHSISMSLLRMMNTESRKRKWRRSRSSIKTSRNGYRTLSLILQKSSLHTQTPMLRPASEQDIASLFLRDGRVPSGLSVRRTSVGTLPCYQE